MENLIGAAMVAFGGWLLWTAAQRRQRVIAAGGPVEMTGGSVASQQLAMMGHIMPPIIIGFLIFAGLKAILAYTAFGLSRHISLFDLGAFLFLLASYGTWLVVMTKYREISVVARDAERGADEQQSVGAGGGGDRVRGGDGVRDLAAEVAQPAEGGAGGRRAA